MECAHEDGFVSIGVDGEVGKDLACVVGAPSVECQVGYRKGSGAALDERGYTSHQGAGFTGARPSYYEDGTFSRSGSSPLERVQGEALWGGGGCHLVSPMKKVCPWLGVVPVWVEAC